MAARHHYQAELDGLRALAVSGVVLCHLDFPWLPGGFVGVDIFFVLSGYLITRLLTGELAETGRLGFRTFYLRRLRRLYPALLTTIAATWVVSFFLLSPHQMRDFASSAFAAVFSLANVQFYLESGYWAALANTKPLLHTWSLSVEEQFYLIWPLLLFALHRLLPRPGVVIAIALISAASLAVSVHWLRTDDAAAFYMLPSRTFELGLGALLVWLPALRHRWLLNAATVTGVVAMLVPMLIYSSATPFPGLAALLPCVGAMLFIIGSRSEAAAPFRLAPIAWLGRISYSLYLVHWPIIVLWIAYFYQPLEGHVPWLLLALSVLAAAAQYYWIEQRFRRPRPARNWPMVTATLLIALTIGGISGAVAVTGGLAWRVPADRQARPADDRAGCYAFNPQMDRSLFTCQNYRKRDKDLFVWGDSHGRHLATGLSRAYPDYNIYTLHYPGCPPQSGYGGFVNVYQTEAVMAGCVERNRKALELFTNGGPHNIILTSYKADKPERIAEVTEQLLGVLEAAGNRVVFLGDFMRPGWNLVDCATVPDYVISDAWRAARCVGQPRVARAELQYNDRLDELVPEFLSVNDIQCPGGICQFFEDGHILFQDAQHLNGRGSTLMVSRLKPLLPF
ncbi:MAG: acyltransferase [Devosia sp.]|uniref:acyltransferase family protein n=1 Tax=Devosia sp. TaxID=1871048 RepID=UPI001A49695D|nr:acyltransferase family protein [Devosia sp.]MBL8596933.1 acyltransferase [Devosia sp.]